MTPSRSSAPYSRAHWYVAGLVIIAGVGFWRDYFGRLGGATWSWHFHGIAASLWIVLGGLQSWTIATRRVALHRSLGKASLALFPFFFASMATIDHTMAAATSPNHPFYRLWGGPLGFVDGLATLAIGWLFFEALRHRRKAQQHARFMLAIPLFLLPPALERVFSHYVPMLWMDGPRDFYFFRWDEHLSIAITVAVCLALYRQAPQYGQAFRVTVGVMIVQSIGFETLGRSSGWLAVLTAFGSLSPPIVILAALAVGTAVTWLGWTVPLQPPLSRQAAPAA